ncbi:hypothetical protein D3C84_1005910 [compost metagenome]
MADPGSPLRQLQETGSDQGTTQKIRGLDGRIASHGDQLRNKGRHLEALLEQNRGSSVPGFGAGS